MDNDALFDMFDKKLGLEISNHLKEAWFSLGLDNIDAYHIFNSEDFVGVDTPVTLKD